MTKPSNPPSLASEDRKDAHLRICLEEAIERPGKSNGFEQWQFMHDALPELDRAEIDISTTVFGKRLAAPLMIGAMTGGTARAGEINRILATAAEKTGIAMALGSQRKMLEKPDLARTFQVRDVAPNILLMGNVGAVQLNYGVTAKDIRHLCNAVGADLFAFHLNALQEAIQPEGDTNFRGLIEQLATLIPEIPVPVVLKEVGSGFSHKTLSKIRHLPFHGIEIAGVGGTSWSKIETFRTNSTIQQMTGAHLADWGVSTAESLVAVVEALSVGRTIIASGGIRRGLEVAKAIALGAHLAASALPFLVAATEGGVDAVVATIHQFMDELRTVCFVTGSQNLAALKDAITRAA